MAGRLVVSEDVVRVEEEEDRRKEGMEKGIYSSLKFDSFPFINS